MYLADLYFEFFLLLIVCIAFLKTDIHTVRISKQHFYFF